MNKKVWTGSILSFLVVLSTLSQGVITGLSDNPVLSSERNKIRKTQTIIDTLDLPFFDDFAIPGPYPDIEKWQDAYAFINNSYPVNPPSIGVATLDAMNDEGKLYPAVNNDPFEADYLTSLPLDLNYPINSNIYLNFFYQPKGLGANTPYYHDSLFVDFYSPMDTTWNRVWAIEGSDIHSFEQVLLPINEEKYLVRGFMFRFGNYASFQKVDSQDKGWLGNTDYWHIDYVYIDTGIVPGSFNIDDISLSEGITGILKNYSSIPARHFPEAYKTEKAGDLTAVYKNLNSMDIKSLERVQTIDIDPIQFHDEDNLGWENINPNSTDTVIFSIREIPIIDNPLDTADIILTVYLTTDTIAEREIYRWNDTVRYYQELYNYYSYDDGTPEATYSLIGDATQVDLQIANKYTMFKEDTLRAIKIYFAAAKDDYTTNPVSPFLFKLRVWPDDNGIPGSLLLYQDTEYRRIDTTGCYSTFILQTPVHVPETYYVGILQAKDDYYKIGFDVNRDSHRKIFVYKNNQWIRESDSTYGSIMIRPVVGYQLPSSSPDVTVDDKRVTIYPLPARDYITIDFTDGKIPDQSYIYIYDIAGKLLRQQALRNNRVQLTDLDQGIYTIQITDHKSYVVNRKLIIAR